MAINIPNGSKIEEIYQHLSLQDTQKFTQIFGLKIYHLATLLHSSTLSFGCEILKKKTFSEWKAGIRQMRAFQSRKLLHTLKWANESWHFCAWGLGHA
jgi:hypothetical protein